MSALIDGCIRDGWIAPEDKWIEVAKIYRGQASANRALHIRLRDQLEAADYAQSWVDRWLEATA